MKSKYNTGDLIDINELTDEERKIAFHEWSEGSQALEQLLIEGYKKGFMSHSCCGGDNGTPYICYNLNDEQSKKIAIYIATRLVESDLDCKVSFDSDFYYTEEEYKEMRAHLLKTFPEHFSERQMSPTRSITSLNIQSKMENREEVFEAVLKSIREVELDKVKLPQTREEIPEKDFKKIIEEVKTTKAENKFITDLESKTYTLNDIKSTESFVNEQPTVQTPVIQGPEIEI